MLRQRKVVSALSLLLLALFVQSAQAFIDPPYLTPSIPLSGQEASINVRTGLCDAVLNEQELTREGNAIRVVFFGVRYFNPELCNLPTFTTTQSIGSYSPGSYTLQVDLMYSGGTGVIQVDTLGVIPFTVEGSPTEPMPAPTNTPLVLLLMAMAIVATAVWKIGYLRSGWLLLVLITTTFNLRAQTPPQNAAIQVLLTTAPGAPTPDQLVIYYSRTPRTGQPPLQSLAASNLLQVKYLIPARASGDFLSWLRENPNSPRAILERYVVVLFPPGTDTAQTLVSLRADPYVTAAYVPLSLPPSSVSLENFDVVSSLQSGGQYGRTDLNIDAAWQIAGGWALVAAIDFGLFEKHSALRQFSDVGNYLGGNFIPAASLDVGVHY